MMNAAGRCKGEPGPHVPIAASGLSWGINTGRCLYNPPRSGFPLALSFAPTRLMSELFHSGCAPQ